ncbi:Uncharacterised protein [Ewingella americana]|uniref:Uncharacterized protein n=1 Tax=Ewingella americana TaxID=41202 RepID=A0A377N855_9GAMM|nr:Uncharacterised protein [Ewingella americana]
MRSPAINIACQSLTVFLSLFIASSYAEPLIGPSPFREAGDQQFIHQQEQQRALQQSLTPRHRMSVLHLLSVLLGASISRRKPPVLLSRKCG